MTPLWPHPHDPLTGEVDRLCRTERLAERYRQLDGGTQFPRREFRALGAARLLGLTLPRRWNGRGLSAGRAGVVLFHLAYRAGTTFSKLAMQPEFCSVLAEQGDPALARRWYRPLLAGRLLIGNQITEPTAGSDATAIALEAHPTEGGYALSGTKSEAAFAVDADAAIVYGRLPGTRGAEGITAFLVPQSLPGIRRRRSPRDLGERWQRRGTVTDDGVRVRASYRIGREGSAFDALRTELVRDRGLLAAIYLGVARASWEETVADVAARTAFGRPLSDRQAVAFPLVDDGAALEAAWLLTQQALRRCEQGDDAAAETALAKVMATEVALATIDHCIQFHGGSGYSSARPHEQRWRDVRSGPIAHGPSEVLRGIAARRLWPPAARDGRGVSRSR